MIRLPSQVQGHANSLGTCWSVLFFEPLKRCNPDLFNVLCSDKIENCAENAAAPDQLLRVSWGDGFRASP